MKKSISRTWHKAPSGILIPGGYHSSISGNGSVTYMHVKEQATRLEKLYESANIPIPRNSDLATLIGIAKKASDAWLSGQADTVSGDDLLRLVYFDRIAGAILLLQEHPARASFLEKLLSGSLDPGDRDPSKAKDTIWELELWSMLKGHGFAAALKEPPDIAVEFENAPVGIACKKLYSERNVEKVLSQAVAQIEPTFSFGIVGISLDDLAPADRLVRAPTAEQAGEFLNEFNLAFLGRHERYFRKYLSRGRLISAWISTSSVADCYAQRVRLYTARQATIWSIPGLPPDKEAQMRRFYTQLMG